LDDFTEEQFPVSGQLPASLTCFCVTVASLLMNSGSTLQSGDLLMRVIHTPVISQKLVVTLTISSILRKYSPCDNIVNLNEILDFYGSEYEDDCAL
jgi:hypothetical protein